MNVEGLDGKGYVNTAICENYTDQRFKWVDPLDMKYNWTYPNGQWK